MNRFLMSGVLAFFALSSYAAVASGLRQDTEGLYGISISDVSVEAAQAMADAKVMMKVQWTCFTSVPVFREQCSP